MPKKVYDKYKPKFRTVGFKSIIDNEGTHKSRCTDLKYDREMYSLNDIQNELVDKLGVLTKLGSKGWASVSVQYQGKWFSTKLNINYKDYTKVKINELIYSYFDDYFSKDPNNPFTDNPKEDVFSLFHINLASFTKKGKGDKEEHCFYHRITELGNIKFSEPSLFYHYLKLPFGSAITHKQAISLQEKLRYNLELTGETSYINPTPNPLYPTYKLTVLANHWIHTETLEDKDKKQKQNIERGLIFVKSDDEYQIIYRDDLGNSIEIDTNSKEARQKYHIINVEELKEGHKIAQEYREIYEASKHKWNLFKTGNVVKTIRKYVKEKMEQYKVDDIQQWEMKFIEKASRRPHCDCKAGTFENVHYYDVRKAYASHLRNPMFKIPIKKPTLITFTQKDADELVEKKFKFTYGIYKAIVEGKDKRFVYNYKNYYTHTDLNMALKLNLKITIREKEGNAIQYRCNECCISASSIFRQLIDDFYEMSIQYPNNKTVKMMLSSIWGTVSQINKKWQLAEVDNLPKNHVICNQKFDEMDWSVATFNYLRPYKCQLARLKPFILARQRETMISYIEDIYADVVYIRCDGFYITKALGYPPEGTIGDLLYKKTFNKLIIQNCNKIISA